MPTCSHWWLKAKYKEQRKEDCPKLKDRKVCHLECWCEVIVLLVGGGGGELFSIWQLGKAAGCVEFSCTLKLGIGRAVGGT